MLRYVTRAKTDVSEVPSPYIIKVKRISELGTTLAITSNRRTMRRNSMNFYAFRRSVRRLLVTANVVLCSSILVILMIEASHSSEASILRRGTWHNVQENDIIHSHRRENLKSYIALTG
jgi:hypothetical protein